MLTVGYTRSRIPPWGLEGGNEGSCNYVEVLRKDGGRERYAIATGIALKAGDVIRVVTGNGAGFGDPKARDPAAVAADVANGYVTAERARAVYGYGGCHLSSPRKRGPSNHWRRGARATGPHLRKFQRSPSFFEPPSFTRSPLARG